MKVNYMVVTELHNKEAVPPHWEAPRGSRWRIKMVQKKVKHKNDLV